MHSYKKGGFILKLIIDGFGKTVAKRDNQIVIKENGKEKDFFLANEISQILFTGKGSITFDALSLLAEHDVFCASIDWKGHVDYTLSAPDRKNAIVKKEQYFALMDSRSGHLAKSLFWQKSKTKRQFLELLQSQERMNNYCLSKEKSYQIVWKNCLKPIIKLQIVLEIGLWVLRDKLQSSIGLALQMF